MRSIYILEAIGIIGSIMILGAFALNSFGAIASTSLSYQMMNLIGGIAFIYYTLKKTAWSSLVVNFAWVLISVVALYRIFSRG